MMTTILRAMVRTKNRPSQRSARTGGRWSCHVLALTALVLFILITAFLAVLLLPTRVLGVLLAGLLLAGLLVRVLLVLVPVAHALLVVRIVGHCSSPCADDTARNKLSFRQHSSAK